MRIAVVSDCHDNIWNVDKMFRKAGEIGALICCGDMCSPFTLTRLAEGLAGPLHVVRGNNDGDLMLMMRSVAKHPNVTLYPTPLGEVELGGRRIAITHFPEIAEPVAASGRYDVVCCGHSHKRGIRRAGRTLLVNPGDVMGLFGEPSFAIYDTDSGEAAFISL